MLNGRLLELRRAESSLEGLPRRRPPPVTPAVELGERRRVLVLPGDYWSALPGVLARGGVQVDVARSVAELHLALRARRHGAVVIAPDVHGDGDGVVAARELTGGWGERGSGAPTMVVVLPLPLDSEYAVLRVGVPIELCQLPSSSLGGALVELLRDG